MNLQTRIETAKRTFRPTNCIGTSLFLAELLNEDRRVYDEEFYGYFFSKLRQVEKPTMGDLVLWQDYRPLRVECVHLAFVLRTNPLVLVTRNGEHNDNLEISERDKVIGANIPLRIQDFNITNQIPYYSLADEYGFYTY